MTGKRFTDDGVEEIENQSFTDNLTGKTYWIDHGLDEIVELLNELYDENIDIKSKSKMVYERDAYKKLCNGLEEENKQLKKELQRIYNVATLNKAIEVLENKYDEMLYDGSDKVKDAMRDTVLRCIEDLDELKDDITAR